MKTVDYFAGLAMQALIAKCKSDINHTKVVEEIVEQSYNIASWMMAEKVNYDEDMEEFKYNEECSGLLPHEEEEIEKIIKSKEGI